MRNVLWWEEPEQLDEADLQRVLRAATSVLSRGGDADLGAPEVSTIPPSALVTGLREALGQEGVAVDQEVARGLVDGPATRPAALAVLRELGREPLLREAINDADRASRQLMVVDPGTLAMAALVLLAVKVRHIRVGKAGVDVRFDPVREGVLARIAEMLGP